MAKGDEQGGQVRGQRPGRGPRKGKSGFAGECGQQWASQGRHVLEVLRSGSRQHVWVSQGLSDREVVLPEDGKTSGKVCLGD